MRLSPTPQARWARTASACWWGTRFWSRCRPMTSARAASPIVSNRRSATPVAAAKALPLVLASASPRRAGLLAQAGIVPARIMAPEIDETPEKQELPRLYVLRMATLKAQTIANIFNPPLEGRRAGSESSGGAFAARSSIHRSLGIGGSGGGDVAPEPLPD